MLCYKKEEEESFCAPLKAAENFLFLFLSYLLGFYAPLKVLKLSSSSFYFTVFSYSASSVMIWLLLAMNFVILSGLKVPWLNRARS